MSEFEDRFRRMHDECEEAIRQQRWDDAHAGFEGILRMLEEVADLSGQGRVHVRLGQLCEARNETDRARGHYMTAQRLGVHLGDRRLQASALHRLAHLVRLQNAAAARLLFQRCIELGADDKEGAALSLAMIGQIDFTEGDEFGGLEKLLTAVESMPSSSESFDHLVEHIGYLGARVDRADYTRLVLRQISNQTLRDRLLGKASG